MAKVVVASLQSKARRSDSGVTVKRVRDAEGKLRSISTLDAGSQRFPDDFTQVFRKNVSKARRDNKKAIGANDVVVSKR